MSDVSESNKIVARRVVEAFGRRPKITEFWDADNLYSVAIAAAVDSPHEGITSYSTVNLSDWPMYVDGREHETRVEIADQFRTRSETFKTQSAPQPFVSSSRNGRAAPA